MGKRVIKELSIKMTYSVTLVNVEVDEDVHDALSAVKFSEIDSSCVLSPDEGMVMDWVADNVKVDDACEYEFCVTGLKQGDDD